MSGPCMLARGNPVLGRSLAIREVQHRICSAALNIPQENPAILNFPESASQFLGDPVSQHFRYASLEDLFGSALADAFHTSEGFRSDLLQFAETDSMRQLFRDVGNAWKGEVDKEQVLIHREQELGALTSILEKHVGLEAPSAFDFIEGFAHLCGDTFQGNFLALGPKSQPEAFMWHIDPDVDDGIGCATVMLGFPPKNNHEGVGVFTELIRLSHKFDCYGLGEIADTMLEAADPDRISEEEIAEADRKAQESLGISDEYRVQPIFKRGQELMIFMNLDHFHRAPTQDVINRDECWRFM